MWLDIDVYKSWRAQIFHQAYIPRRLEEVDDHEGDFERLAAGGDGRATEGIYYQTIAGMRPDMTGAAAAPAVVAAAARLPGSGARLGSDASGASDEEGFDLEARLSGATEAGSAREGKQHASVGGNAAEGDNWVAVQPVSASEQQGSESESSSDDDESDSDEDAEGEGVAGRQERPKKDPEADKAARKQHKAEVKEANREKRKHKLKKHVKKRAINKHKHK